MNKTYKIQLPRNKEAQNIRTNIKDGTIEVEVELKERWKPRDGEICYIKAYYEHIFIFNKLDDDVIAYVAFTPCTKQLSNFNKIAIICDTDDIRKFRPATDFEKQLLFDALAEQNKRWNAEKKVVEDVRWRAMSGGKYYYLIFGNGDYGISETADIKTRSDNSRYLSGNYFKTEEAARIAGNQILELLKLPKGNADYTDIEKTLRKKIRLSKKDKYRIIDSLMSYPFFIDDIVESHDALMRMGTPESWHGVIKHESKDNVRWRAEKGEPYYHIIGFDNVICTTDEGLMCDDNRYFINNYFKTRKAAEKVAEQIREIFKNSKAE